MNVQIATGISVHASARTASEEAAAEAAEGLGGRQPDLVATFATADHLKDANIVVSTVTGRLRPRSLIGCVAQGVIGQGREIETGPGVTVWAASFGAEAAVHAFHLPSSETEVGMDEFADTDLAVLIADPVTFDTERLLGRLRASGLDIPIVGGQASASRQPHKQALFVNGEIMRSGAVGIRLLGVEAVASVSQGAAPVGPEMVVTSAERNVIYELASQPALHRLEEVFAGADPRERALLSRGLLLGVVIDENKPDYLPDDYLIRGVTGTHPDSGALVIGDRVRVGQTVRVHVRDPSSADADLKRELDSQHKQLNGKEPRGALLFCCNGRGSSMFGKSGHDADAISQFLGNQSLGGCFCAGEVGPLSGRNFLHGFTVSMAVFADGKD